MILVQITDTHIDEPGTLVYGHFDTSRALAQAIETINAMRPTPDLVLHTGDIASGGSIPRYEAFKRIAGDLTVPLVVMPGNHDDRDAMRAVFGGTSWLPLGDSDGDFLHYVIEDQAVRIICCDSVIAGEVPGEMCPQRLAWLDARLGEASDRPTIVALHHPPFYTGMTGTTAKGLRRGGDELDALLRRHPQVVRVLAGHTHRPITAGFGGTIAFVCPTTCYPFGLDTGPERILNVVKEPPGIAVHLWLPDGSPSGPDLVSHVQPVGDWGDSITLLKEGVRVLAS